MHGRDLRISAKMGFSCLTEISKLVCPYQGNKGSLESWDIIEVPLDIILEIFVRILCIIVIHEFGLKWGFLAH